MSAVRQTTMRIQASCLGVPFTSRGEEKSRTRKILTSAPINSTVATPEMASFNPPDFSQPEPTSERSDKPRASAPGLKRDSRSGLRLLRSDLSRRRLWIVMQRQGILGSWFLEKIHLRLVFRSELFFRC